MYYGILYGTGLCNYRIGPWKVVAPHDLHVGLLQNGNPQLILVIGEGAQQVSILAHWQRVIHDYLQRKWPVIAYL